jgi:hypothetical protein
LVRVHSFEFKEEPAVELHATDCTLIFDIHPRTKKVSSIHLGGIVRRAAHPSKPS